jgi:hypothetical protein
MHHPTFCFQQRTGTQEGGFVFNASSTPPPRGVSFSPLFAGIAKPKMQTANRKTDEKQRLII